MAANQPDPFRILSIQSHVVSGFVGNRSATFPLQLLGWDVDVANTVQFSNHTGYGRWGGQRFDSDHMSDLFVNLERNGLLRYSRMLTGYMPSSAVVSAVKDLVERQRRKNPDLIYLLDPVMGDMGRGMYVDKSVLPIYKQMLPLSTIVCPNQFEAQILSGLEIRGLESLKEVLLSLHLDHGVRHVLITSVELPEQDLEAIGARRTMEEDGRPAMLLVGSSLEPRSSSEKFEDRGVAKDLKPWFIQFPEVQGYFSGVGDLFAALTLGRFQPPTRNNSSPADGSEEGGGEYCGTAVAKAAEQAIASLQGVLAKTCKVIEEQERLDSERGSKGEGDSLNKGEVDEAVSQIEARVEMMRRRELRIVQSREEIERPVVKYRARWLRDSRLG
ncbi:Ribokinase-like protein [Violaceomyces palustris]|uniref:Ribokinase-like protein n=1 Tax=Violaceomyces palustris TaxID=1673888 RepID=A0ACD0P1R5_9BASI|nr:Ribokinase-like protein [Violaceomyces palustris]